MGAQEGICVPISGKRIRETAGTAWRNYPEISLVARTDTKKPKIFAHKIPRARSLKNCAVSEYISFATKSDSARKFFFDNAIQTVNLASINLTSLSKVPLPIPPLNEQCEIVRRVEALFKFADGIEAKYTAARIRIDKLSQSILSKAFRGGL